MKKLFVALSMAWGNFLSIPCPWKAWDSKLKNTMLALLPIIGTIAGILWVLIVVGSMTVFESAIPTAFVLTFSLYAISGFMHMDGFMDVNDAVLSQRELSKMQAILKDSKVGAFAVVTTIFLVLGTFSFSMVIIQSAETKMDILPLFFIPVVSRATAGFGVLSFKPLDVSQYSKTHELNLKKNILLIVVLTFVTIGASLLVIQNIKWNALQPFTNENLKECIVAIVATFIGTMSACVYGRYKLKGINGDIGGYAICIGELVGIAALSAI